MHDRPESAAATDAGPASPFAAAQASPQPDAQFRMRLRACERPRVRDSRDDLPHALLTHATVKTFPKNTLVICEGDLTTDSIYLVRSGRVKVYLCSAAGKEVDLDVLGRGDYFGELALDHGPRSASAATLERTELAIIRQSEFRQCLSTNPEFAMRFMLKLIARNRSLLKHVKSLALLDVAHRVARLLLELATEQDGKLIITEKLSKRDIANRVGATREMASRAFKNLVTSGYIELENETITIAKKLPQQW